MDFPQISKQGNRIMSRRPSDFINANMANVREGFNETIATGRKPGSFFMVVAEAGTAIHRNIQAANGQAGKSESVIILAIEKNPETIEMMISTISGIEESQMTKPGSTPVVFCAREGAVVGEILQEDKDIITKRDMN